MALGALLLRLNGLAFGEPYGGEGPSQASFVPMFAHLALVAAAGIYLPAVLVAWFQHVARCWGRQCLRFPITPTLREVLRDGPAVAAHRPWPRVVVTAEGWEHAISLLRSGQCTLLGLWGETGVRAHGAA